MKKLRINPFEWCREDKEVKESKKIKKREKKNAGKQVKKLRINQLQIL